MKQNRDCSEVTHDFTFTKLEEVAEEEMVFIVADEILPEITEKRERRITMNEIETRLKIIEDRENARN